MLKFVSYFLCVLPCIFVASAQVNPPSCYQPGECTQSLYVGDWPAPDIQSCLDLCQSQPECHFFTYEEIDHICFGFVNCEVFDELSCESCYSGSENCDDVQCSVQGRCDGILIDHLALGTNEDCLQACQANQSCQWATFNNADSNCSLLENCLILDDECDTCLTSQRHCSFAQSGYTKIFVVGGYTTSTGRLDTVQVIDLKNPYVSCTLQPYPKRIDAPVVAFIDGVLKVCGGFPETEDCFDYSPSNQWAPASNMLYARYHPQSSIIDDQWLVTGDDDSPGDLTTEVWSGGSAFQEAQLRLPVEMSLHCQITLNDSALFFADVYSTNEFFILAWPSGQILAQGSIPNFRPYGSCGLIESTEYGQEIVIVGEGNSDILNLNALQFRGGPDMPEQLDQMASVQYQDTFLLLGGNVGDRDYDTIYQFDQINYDWILLDQKLEQASHWVGAALVPEDFVGCS